MEGFTSSKAPFTHFPETMERFPPDFNLKTEFLKKFDDRIRNFINDD